MAVVFGAGGPRANPDDEKAQRTHSLCNEWNVRLADPEFTSKLPKGAKGRLQSAVNKVWFDLAVYRGELRKGMRGQSVLSPGGLATTTTVPRGDGPTGVVIALAALAAAAIAVIVAASTQGVLAVGKALESSLERLRSASDETAITMTPIPLNFSPGMSPHLLNELVSRGVIVVAGGLMAISISKLRDYIDSLRDEVKEAAAGKICPTEVAALESIVNALAQMADEFEKMLQDGIAQSVKDAMLKAITDLLMQAKKAAEALSECLSGGMFNPSPTKPPENGLN